MIEYNDELNCISELDDQGIIQTNYKVAVRKILLIGNGFDIRAGLKSSCLDFFIFITYGCALYNYNNIEQFKLLNIQTTSLDGQTFPKQLQVLLNDNKKTYKDCHDFANSYLGDLFFRHLFQTPFVGMLSKPEILLKDEKNIYLNLLLTIYGIKKVPFVKDVLTIPDEIPTDKLGKGLETFSFITQRIFENIKGDIKLWVDVESVIEMIITRSEDLKDKYNFKEDIKRDYSSSKSFLNGLELFEILLAKYLKSIKSIDITEEKSNLFFENICDKFSQSAITRSFKRVKNLDISNPDVVINYNYTDIAERYFEAIGHKPEFFYVNGSLDAPKDLLPKEFCTNIVVGYTNSNNVKVNKELFPFEKKSRRIIKNTQYIDIDKIINKERFDLVIMGHSCGIADSDVFQKLLSSKYLKTALVLCHSTDDLISSFNNIRAMVGEEKFSELMTFEKEKITNNLYFVVEDLGEQTDKPKDNKCEE